MKAFEILLFVFSVNSSFAAAWIQMLDNSRARSNRHNIRLHDRNRVGIDPYLSDDVKSFNIAASAPKGRLIHVPGMFESLSSLPVHNWADPSFDDMVCRDDDCDKDCEIPDEWKDSVHADVLGFLGIKRAKPLNIRKKMQ
jgi:hypothetical protein